MFDRLLIVGKKVCSYNAHTKQELHLEECGLKLYIPEAVITPVESVYHVAVQGLWGREFVFPEGTKLISGICYISISSSTELNKPVTVQLDHCADIVNETQTKYLSFVVADSTKLPYKFELLPGGIFNVHSHFGTISLKKFSLVAIVIVANSIVASVSAHSGAIIGGATVGSTVVGAIGGPLAGAIVGITGLAIGVGAMLHVYKSVQISLKLIISFSIFRKHS